MSSSSRLEENRIAHRYARALFEKADAEGKAEEMLRDLEALQTVFLKSPDITAFFANPAIPIAEKFEIIQTYFCPEHKQAAVNAWMANLLKLLAEHERMGAFPALVDQYRDMLHEKNNIAVAEVTTAIEIEADLLHRIKHTLEKLYGFREVILHPRVNPALLGGIVIKIQDKILDGSYIGRLEALRHA